MNKCKLVPAIVSIEKSAPHTHGYPVIVTGCNQGAQLPFRVLINCGNSPAYVNDDSQDKTLPMLPCNQPRSQQNDNPTTWYTYKLVLKTVTRCIASVLVKHDTVDIQGQLDELDRLNRVIKCIRQSYAMHPSLLERNYVSTEGYLEKHLVKEDWLYWTRQTIIKSIGPPQLQCA